jgi:hypothetical protein
MARRWTLRAILLRKVDDDLFNVGLGASSRRVDPRLSAEPRGRVLPARVRSRAESTTKSILAHIRKAA